MVTKLKNLNCDKTQKNNYFWQNPNCYQSEQLKMWQISSYDKTQIVTKLNLWQNSITQHTHYSNYDKTQKLKLWQLKKQNCDQTEKLKLWQNSKNQIVTTLEFCQIYIYEEKNFQTDFLVRRCWHLDNRWNVLWAAFCNSCGVFLVKKVCARKKVICCFVLWLKPSFFVLLCVLFLPKWSPVKCE